MQFSRLTMGLLMGLVLLGAAMAGPNRRGGGRRGGGKREARRNNKRGNGGGGFSFYGPVTAEYQCEESTRDVNAMVFTSKEKKPAEFCSTPSSELCFCVANGKQAKKAARKNKPVNYKFRCAPCSFNWNYKKAKKQERRNRKNV